MPKAAITTSTTRRLWSSLSSLPFILLLWLSSKVVVESAQAPELGKKKLDNDDDAGCDLLLAESSIPNAGLGVYAVRNFKLGEKIGHPSIGIPVTDMSIFKEVNQTELSQYGALPEYLWEPQNIGGFGEALHVDLFLPGAASLVNHHSVLDNVIVSGLTLDRELHRDTNPMAGSFTAYHGYTLIAKRNIKAGEELFVDKTTENMKQREYFLGNIPSLDDYAEADEIVAAFRNTDYFDSLTDAQWVDVLHRLKTEAMPIQAMNVANALPSSFDEIRRAWEVGTARMPLRERTVEWIKNNGQCLDGIKEGTSTIQDAGRGAFATKTFRQGSTVSVSPLVQIPDKTVLDISHRGDSNSTQQLLYNYCFGHRKSSLLLCPTTHAAMINHDSRKANVALRWVRSNDGGDDLTVSSIDSLGVNSEEFGEYNTRLQLEYVALRDIGEGEELFLDYGKEWEDALLNHVEHGTSSVDESRYVSAKSLTAASLKMDDGGSIVDQSHIYECKVYPNAKQLGNPVWEEYSSNQNIDQRNWPAEFVAWYEGNEFASWYPCKILDGDSRSGLYNIELFMKPLTAQRVARMFKNIPRNRIRIADGLYQSDQHLPWSFRQYVPMPDSLFPLRWRNDYQTSASLNLGKVSQEVGTPALVEDYERALREAKCGLYLAKSNIPNAGFGTYTAVDIPGGNMIVGSTMSSIPTVATNKTLWNKWPGKDYVWGWSSFMKGYEFGRVDVSFLAGLFGALANAHTGITNMDQDRGKVVHMLDRTSDPGAGAFSPFVEYSFRSMYPIQAGEELFVSYGEGWFKGRSEFRDVPLKQNFNEADQILASIWSMATLEGASLQVRAVNGLLQVFRERIVSVDRHRTRMALGAIKTFDDLSHAVGRNGTAPATVEAKSAEWLDKNGFCLDHIYVDKSSIEQAGYGAFARRPLKRGDVIISAPAIATSRDYLAINSTSLDIHPTQMLMNYHFGHKHSSMLFFPLNQAININHSSGRKRSGQEPNARVEFSTKDARSRYIFARSLDDLKKEKYSAMVLDFVATRDIEPDEEVVIDYGREWEDAWDKHLKEWSSPCWPLWGACTASSSAIAKMNDDKFNSAYHEWSEDHFTACRVDEKIANNAENYIWLTEKAPTNFNDAMNPNITTSYEGIGYSHEGFGLAKITGQMRFYMPCMVMSASRSKNEFSVVRFSRAPNGQGHHGLLVVKNLSAGRIMFMEKPLKSDVFRPGAFRHEIAIPDDSFPTLWRDLE